LSARVLFCWSADDFSWFNGIGLSGRFLVSIRLWEHKPFMLEAKICLVGSGRQILAAKLKKPMFAVYFTFEDRNIGISSLI
jgi:hypothetical protein